MVVSDASAKSTAAISEDVVVVTSAAVAHESPKATNSVLVNQAVSTKAGKSSVTPMVVPAA